MKIKSIVSLALPVVMLGAANAAGTKVAHGGFSVGAQFGYITQDSKLSHNYQIVPNTHRSVDLSGRGIIGGLNLAYGYVFKNNMFLGLEIKGDFSDLKGSVSEGATTIFNNKSHLKMTNSFGGALKFGGAVCHVLPYAKVGVLWSEWKSSTRTFFAVHFASNKKHSRKAGLELGIGIDVPITDKFVIGGEFTHVEYQKISYKNIWYDDAAPTVPHLVMKKSDKPRTNAFMLRAKFRVF